MHSSLDCIKFLADPPHIIIGCHFNRKQNLLCPWQLILSCKCIWHHHCRHALSESLPTYRVIGLPDVSRTGFSVIQHPYSNEWWGQACQSTFFRRPTFPTCVWALPLVGRGGYVPKDNINATIMNVMTYQYTIKWLPLILACCRSRGSKKCSGTSSVLSL